MPSVQNPFDHERVVPGYPSFAANEIRECSDEDAAVLTDGSGLVLETALEEAPANDSPRRKGRPSSPAND